MARPRWLGTAAIYAVLTLLSIVWLVPVMTVVMTAVRPFAEIREGWWNLAGASLTLDNFGRAWQEAGLAGKTMNSLIITGFSVASTVAVGALAAYAFTRMRFRGRGLLYFLLITTMIVPVPNEANVELPVRYIPAIATITVRPETSTARPDVAAAASSAASLERPALRSSRSRLM